MTRLLLLVALLALPGIAEAAAPTFVTHTATVFNTTTTPKTASVAVQAGDLLVAFAISADASATFSTPTNDGAALTWTMRQTNATANNAGQELWTAPVDTARTIVVTCATSANPSSDHWGCDVIAWRSATVGASAKITAQAMGAPTMNITTTQANSAIVVAIGDWSAVAGAPTWRTNAGAFTSTVELAGDGLTYAARGGYHADSGAIATYAVGTTLPTGETYSIVAIEVKGPAGGAAVPSRTLTGVGS